MKPVAVIVAGSVDVTAAVMLRLESLTLTDNAGEESDTLELALENTDERLEAPAEGVLLNVSLGYDGAVISMGQFVVDEVSAEGPPSKVTIKARSTPFDPGGLFGTMQTKKRRSFELTTVGELVATIAAESKLAPVVSASMAAIPLPHIDQTDESDIHLLQRIAYDLGAMVKPTFGRLLFIGVAGGTTASGIPLIPSIITRSMVSGYTFNKCRREDVGCVIACYRNPSTGIDIEVPVGTGKPVERMRYHYPSAAAALAAAKARYSEAVRGSGNVSVTMPGNPLLQAESKITLTGFPLAIDGDWTAKKVTHVLTPSGGYTTTVECETEADEATSGSSAGSSGGGSLDAGGLDPVAPLTPSVP